MIHRTRTYWFFIAILFCLSKDFYAMKDNGKNAKEKGFSKTTLSQDARRNILRALASQTRRNGDVTANQEQQIEAKNISPVSLDYHPFLTDALSVTLKYCSKSTLEYLIDTCKNLPNSALDDSNALSKTLFYHKDIDLFLKIFQHCTIDLTSKNHKGLLVRLLTHGFSYPEKFLETSDFYAQICPLLIERGIPLNNEIKIGDYTVITAPSLAIRCIERATSEVAVKTFAYLFKLMLDYGINPHLDPRLIDVLQNAGAVTRTKLLYSYNLYTDHPHPPFRLQTPTKQLGQEKYTQPNVAEYQEFKELVLKNTNYTLMAEICCYKLCKNLRYMRKKAKDCDIYFTHM